MPTARCAHCKQERDTAEFNRRSNGSPASYCKPCQHQYQRKHYAKNLEVYKARRNKQHKLHRQQVLDLLRARKDVPCTDCGERHPYWVMEFDHCRGTKKFTISEHKHYSLSKLEEELSKCDVVCAVCHRYRTYGTRRTSSARSTDPSAP